MTEQTNEAAGGASSVTGDPAVDSVLASLAGLDDAPVGEHVPVYEAAHEQLRRALDARPEN